MGRVGDWSRRRDGSEGAADHVPLLPHPSLCHTLLSRSLSSLVNDLSLVSNRRSSATICCSVCCISGIVCHYIRDNLSERHATSEC